VLHSSDKLSNLRLIAAISGCDILNGGASNENTLFSNASVSSKSGRDIFGCIKLSFILNRLWVMVINKIIQVNIFVHLHYNNFNKHDSKHENLQTQYNKIQ